LSGIEADCTVEAILLLMLSLADSDKSRWRDRTASTLDTIDLVSIRLGITQCFSLQDSTWVSVWSKETTIQQSTVLLNYRYQQKTSWTYWTFALHRITFSITVNTTNGCMEQPWARSPFSVVVAEIVMQHMEECALATCRQTIPLYFNL